jgi:hypothetical protein
MNRPRRETLVSRRRRCVLLAAAAVAIGAALTIAPPSASAASRGYHVYNFSSYPIRLDDSSGDFSEGRPPYGALLYPGASYHDFELGYTYYSPYPDYGTVHYSILDNNARKIGEFWPHMENAGGTRVYCTLGQSSPGQCSPAGRSENDFTSGATMTYLDPPGTVHNIGADQSQAQLAAMQQFCADDNAATCAFTPTSEHEFESPAHQVGNALNNNTDEEQETEIRVEDTVGSSNSVGVDVKLGGKLFGVVEVAITGKYEHEWSTEHTFEQSVTVHCPARSKCWVSGVSPMLRDTGNFTIKLGNTTWNLAGVYFDSPNPKGNGAYEVDAKPLSPSEQANLPAGLSVQRQPGGIYALPSGVRIVKPKLRLAITGPRQAAPGQIVSHRVTVRRSQPDNRPVFAPKNIRITVTHAGRPLRRWVHRKLPRDEARTHRHRVKVPTTSRGRFCVTVKAAAKNARSTRTRHCARVAL